MALLIPAEIGMAALSDRIGRRPVLLAVTGLAVVAAWPDLHDALKAGILAMVKAARGGGQ